MANASTNVPTALDVSWAELCERRGKEFERESGGSIGVQDFNTFQTRLKDLREQYAKRGAAKWFQKLIPTMEHVKSFTSGISSITQANTAATLIWGGLLLVIECICRFSKAVESIMDLIAQLNDSLPLLSRGMALFPGRAGLQIRVRDILDTYLDCCIAVIKYLKRSQIKNFFRGIISSSLQNIVKSSSERIEQQDKNFFREVEQIHREAAIQSDLEHTTRLGEGSKLHITTITIPRNQWFVGRQQVLNDIHTFFTGEPNIGAMQPSCCVLHGLGGQGKTQTALEYTYLFRDEYDATIWINAETEQNVLRSLEHFATLLQQKGEIALDAQTLKHDTSLQYRIAEVRQWLETTERRWLLVFDNLEDFRLADAYIPTTVNGRGSIIATTQKVTFPRVTSSFKHVALAPLSADEGAKLLLRILEREAESNVEASLALEISNWVDGLPLAIATIGGFIKFSTFGLSETFASLKRSSKIWGSSGQGTVQHYDKTLATVFDLALSELDSIPNARHFIDILSFLDPTSVPQDMLLKDHGLPSLKFLSNKDEFMDITYALSLRQLVKRTELPAGPAYSIHRSLQLNILHAMKDDMDTQKRDRLFGEAFRLVRNVIPEATKLQTAEPAIWPAYHRYVPQVISLRRNSVWPDPPLKLDLSFARMLADVGTFLWNTGQYQNCEAAMTTASEIVNAQSDDLRNSATSKSLLSDIYNITGILADCVGVSLRDQSLKHREVLLQLRKDEYAAIPPSSVTVPDEIRLWNAWGDLACAYMQRARFQEAGEIFEKMHQQYQTWGSEAQYPYEYFKYYHHSAFVLMARGRSNDAIRFARKGVILAELHMKEVEVDETVLISRYDLASLLFNAGQLEESLQLHRETLKQRQRLCGDASQYTLESHEAIGIILFLDGKSEEAKKHFEACLASRFRACWGEEGLARAHFWYARVLAALGDERAKTEHESAIDVKNRFLRDYGCHLREDPGNEASVFDQMLPMWVMQTSGKLQEGGRNPSNETP